MPVVPEVEGLRWSAHDGRHYPENHLNRAYGDSVRAATDPIVKSLPASQRNALSDYTGAAYESVNAYLRDPVKFEKTNGAEAAQRAAKSAALTRSAMARMPRAPADMVLFRGLSLERDDVQADALASGGELTFPSFGSFSRSPRVARSFAAQKDVSVFYRVRRHQSGVLVEGISQIAGENEVIFPPGTRFRIVARQRVSNEALLLDIEEITDD